MWLQGSLVSGARGAAQDPLALPHGELDAVLVADVGGEGAPVPRGAPVAPDELLHLRELLAREPLRPAVLPLRPEALETLLVRGLDPAGDRVLAVPGVLAQELRGQAGQHEVDHLDPVLVLGVGRARHYPDALPEQRLGIGPVLPAWQLTPSLMWPPNRFSPRTMPDASTDIYDVLSRLGDSGHVSSMRLAYHTFGVGGRLGHRAGPPGRGGRESVAV